MISLGSVLTASATKRRAFRSDAAYCAAVTRHHARTFALASRFLPAKERRGAFAVYAFCRVADDIVDSPLPATRLAPAAGVRAHRLALSNALNGGPDGPVFRELAWAVHHFGIPHEPLYALLEAVSTDLEPLPMESWDDLQRYCDGVASTVGEMCAHVFGLPEQPRARQCALRHARTLGVAMQLTNILRDVGEDAARGRCYLPTDDLAHFGIARQEVLARSIAPDDPRWKKLMLSQVRRARALYASAEAGLALLPRETRVCATICAHGYAGILDALEQIQHDTLSRRARVSARTKAWIAFAAWRAHVIRAA
ncbi:MAG: phytoene/squalene synthase family protein [Gemmatimonadota bacterium]